MMQTITSLVLAAFAAYVGAWYMGALEGNFALLLPLRHRSWRAMPNSAKWASARSMVTM